MRKMKFLTALLVAIMVSTTIAPAVFAEESTTQTGDGTSEGIPADDIFRVVLPTTTTETYDFILDPSDLLSTSSLDGDRDAYNGDSVYFTNVDSAATVTLSSDGSNAYIEEYTVLDAATPADLATLNADLTVTNGAVDVITADTFYVWTPVSGSEATGVGEWTAITLANVADYFSFTFDTDSGDGDVTDFEYAALTACDELLYVKTFEEVAGADAVAYCTVVAGDVTAVDGLFGDSSGATLTLPDDLTYTAATSAYTGTSETATAINKSTFGVILNVQTDIANTTTPVTLTTTAAVEGDTETNLAIDILGDDGSAVANVAGTGDGTADVDFYLSGTDANYTQYQGADDAATGGHTYNYLEKTTATWSDLDFGLQAACNTTADWTDYNADLAADNRLELTLTFTMTDASDVEVGDNYNAGTGVIQVQTGDVPSIDTLTYVVEEGVAEEVTVTLGTETNAATGITSVNDGADLTVTTDYTFSGTTLTLTSTYIDSILGDGTADVSEDLVVTFNDVSATEVTITLTCDAYNPSVTLTADGLITILTLSADKNIEAGAVELGTDTLFPLDDESATWDTSSWTAETGGTVTIQLEAAYFTAYGGEELNVEVTLSDASVITTSATLNVE